MGANTKNGNIVIPLLIFLFIAATILYLSKFFNQSQADVVTAIDSHYEGFGTIALSAKMDPSQKWTTHTNQTYKYKVYFPKQWVGTQIDSKKEPPDVLEKFLSNKVKLKVTVTKNVEIPYYIKPTTFGNNSFYYYQDTNYSKTAVTKKNDLYYIVELTQDNYFSSPQEYRAVFFQILKNWELLN